MKDILKTEQLEFENSAYLLDLIKHTNHTFSVDMIQTIHNNQECGQKISVHPSVLTEIIKTLQNYQAIIQKQIGDFHVHLTDTEKAHVVTNYLKGVTIKNLGLQYNQSEELIEMVLRNNHIEIVSNELPEPPRKTYVRKSSKFKRR